MRVRHEESIQLASQLRACAEHLENSDRHVWNAVLSEMDRCNPEWARDCIGVTTTDLVIAELRRLYAIEETVKLAMRNKP